MKKIISIAAVILLITACNKPDREDSKFLSTNVLTPAIITDTVPRDSDDPAIWVHPLQPELSLILGVDKSKDGGLYVFDLNGKMDTSKTFLGLNRPNNIDVAYEFTLGNKKIDIAGITERKAGKMRIFSVPDIQPVDGGGIQIFEGEEQNEGMGIAFYTQPESKKIYAIVGRKNGPSGTYLWQYELINEGNKIGAKVVRKFGKYSGEREIEAIAVDNENGFVYYCDEGVGVRKYYADPIKGNEEIALFATNGFADDHEGISIYKTGEKTGYILVSDQQANRFHIFPREGTIENEHTHPLLKIITVKANQSDGSESNCTNFGAKFPKGIFVAMSDDKTYHIYDWAIIEAEINNSSSSLAKK